MAKKKTVEATQTKPVDDGYKYHAVFTPTWRPQVDLGELEGSFAHVQECIIDDIAQFAAGSLVDVSEARNDIALVWTQINDHEWVATGHDGILETNLPIVKLTRVSAE